ncbi:MAG: hypothetical protein Q7V58_05265 [Actinomycetota bacterium]|nr:hypothetical protein [Actinomycetota bacterium]
MTPREPADLIDRLAAFGAWLAARPAALVVSVLIAASLLKSGFVVWNWFELSPMLLTNWGAPDNSFQANILFNALGTAWAAVGFDTTSMPWLLSQVVLVVAVIVTLSVLLLRRTRTESDYLALAVVLSSGIAAVLWREIGRYDSLFILGIAVATLVARQWLSWLGAVVAALASPEQLLVAAVILLMVAITPPFREWRPLAVRLLVASVAVLVAIQVWFAVAGDPYKTRIGILLPFISGEKIDGATAYDPSQGFVRFTIEKAMVTLQAGPSLVWSYLGASVLVLVLCLLLVRTWWIAAYVVLVVTAVPLTVSTLFGEDRTRDLVMICAPAILAIAIVGSRTIGQLARRLPGGATPWLAWAAVIVTLIPLTYFYLDAEEPFHWLKELLISINNGVPFPQDGSPR